MKLLHAILATVPVAMAAPSQLAAWDTQDVQVTFQLSKLTQEAAIEVWNKYETELLGQSCTDSIDSGAFKDTPIAFTVNEHGAGEVQVGAAKYKTYGNENADTITCGRVTDSVEIMIKCQLSLPAAVPLAPLRKRDLANCFPNGPVALTGLMKGLAGEMESTLPQVQLSEVMRCTQGQCTVGYQSSRSFTIGWTASLSGGGWISAGFAVERSHTTGTSHECWGQPGEVMAIWKKVAQTAYTAQRHFMPVCSADTWGEHYVMWSPNQNNRGGEFYCVYGQQYVRSIGDNWLEHGRAGGP